MARISLVDPATADGDGAALLRAIAEERGYAFNVYRVLANSPGVLRHVYGLASFLWNESTLPPKLQELVILKVAQLCRSDYEWARHRELARRAGVTDQQVEALQDPLSAPPATFDEAERVALALTVEVTNDVAAEGVTVAAARRVFGERGTLELVTLVGVYGLVARVLRSLEVDLEPGDQCVL